jgi:hypothetical protein
VRAASARHAETGGAMVEAITPDIGHCKSLVPMSQGRSVEERVINENVWLDAP